MQTTFDQDFPFIMERRSMKSSKKKQDMAALHKAAEMMSSKTYHLMISAFEDLVSKRRGIRIAFNYWLTAVGLMDAKSAKAVEGVSNALLVLY
jgi:hypothetical protein